MSRKIKMSFSAFLIFLIISGCSSSMNNTEESKYGASLKHKVLSAPPDEVIGILMQADKNISERMREEIEQTGIRVQSVVNEIATAAGIAEQIKESAALPFIIKLELSEKRNVIK
jgi:PBP1b-binding outer membrane lipoprotein LpoB